MKSVKADVLLKAKYCVFTLFMDEPIFIEHPIEH